MKSFSRRMMLVMLMSLMGARAFASFGVENADGIMIYYDYNYVNNLIEAKVVVPSSQDIYAGNIVIPEEISYKDETLKVTAIDNAAFGWCPDLISVTIPKSVLTIGSYAFAESPKLMSVTFSSGVNYIGEGAFYNSKGTLYISDMAAWCKIVFDGFDSRPDNICITDQNGNLMTHLNIPEGTTVIGNDLFRGFKSIFSATIPNSVTTIGDYAFYKLEISNVIIPNNVTTIGECAFSNAYALKSVTIGSSVTSIGSKAFYRTGGKIGNNLPALEAVVTLITEPFEIPGLADIENSPFNAETFENTILYVPAGTIDKYKSTNGWKDFADIREGDGRDLNYEPYNDGKELMVVKGGLYSGDVVIPEEATYMGQTLKVTAIAEEAFSRCGGLNSVTIPNTVTFIGNFAFYECTALTSVKLPNSLKTIEYRAFVRCSSLSSIIIPEGVTEIDTETFGECTSLTSVEIPNSVTSIGEEAFHNTGLTYVTIPNSVTTIAKGAFKDCYNLTAVSIGSGVTELGSLAFRHCDALKKFISLVEEPFETEAFKNLNIPEAILYVPAGTVDKYKNTKGWEAFRTILEADHSGINKVKVDQKENAPIYDLNGRLLSRPQKGINIIDGKKVLIK